MASADPSGADAAAQDAPVQQPASQPATQFQGADLRIDPSWAAAAQSPEPLPGSSNIGANPALDQIWAAVPSGYNLMRTPLDVRDPAAATRALSLCAWAKNNNVKLLFVLSGADPGEPLPQDYPKAAAEFIKNLVAQFRNGGDQALAGWAQIKAFQIENELNHPGRHGGMTAPKGKDVSLAAAKSLRKAQTEALKGSSLQAVPLAASASFDFPLVQAGAIAGVPLTDAAYDKAYQELKNFLSASAASNDIDFLVVDWFAGSISAGSADRFPQLLDKLVLDLPGKRLFFTSGFSSVGHTADQQQSFVAGFSDLANFCASRGGDCRLAGTILHELLNGTGAVSGSQSAAAPADWQTWDWTAKAAELTAMWTKGKNYDNLAQWLAAEDNSMGLVTLQTDSSQSASTPQTPSPGTPSAPNGNPADSPLVNQQTPGGQPPVGGFNPNTGSNSGNQPPCMSQPASPAGGFPQTPAATTCQSFGAKQMFLSPLANFLQQTSQQAATAVVQKILPGSRTVPGGTYSDPGAPVSNSGGPPAAVNNTPGGYPINAPNNGLPTSTTQPWPVTADTTTAGTTSQSGASNGGANLTGNPSGNAGAVPPDGSGSATTVQMQAPATSVQVQQTIPSGANSRPNNRGSANGTLKFQQVVNVHGPQSPQGPTTGGQQPGSLPTQPPQQSDSQKVVGLPDPGYRPGQPVQTLSLNPRAANPSNPVNPSKKASGAVNLSVTGYAIRLTPAQPRVGEKVTFVVIVSNLGAQPSQYASATFVLFGGSKQFMSPPIRFSVGGHGTAQVSWTTTLPNQGGSMNVKVTVADAQDSNPAADKTNMVRFLVTNR
jgi:hypothetical protein